MSIEDDNWTLCFPRSSSNAMVVKSPKPSLVPAYHVLLKMDRFGFSANNVTYQALGEHPSLRYYDFYPAPDNPEEKVSEKTHGVVPVWGFATVLVSSHPKIRAGERLYGYFAPAKYILLPIDPTDINKFAMYVPRPQFPPDRRLYHQIIRCSTDPLYTEDTEDLQMIYRPLFWTSYWCEDWLACSGYHGGCDNILISSASSKTAFCFAYCVRKRAAQDGSTSNIRIIGLTSKKNVAFTKKLGLYHEVYDYDSFTSAIQGGKGKRWIYVDVAGNDDFNRKVVERFTSGGSAELVTSISLGMSSMTPESSTASGYTEEDAGGVMNANGSTFGKAASKSTFWPKLERFFTPEWVEIRRKQLPLQEIFDLQKREWHTLMKECVGWIEVERIYGPQAVKKSYERIASSGVGPDKGLVWSLWDAPKQSGKAKL
ncbi:hypothetical protein AAF712_004719 [Marasmius tenuissimus]|uniref:DUF2855 family protein n=1 Tax=Marasmius tenuissimus TaxID=585030 RepID=A0ABR3A4L2_9AGAR